MAAINEYIQQISDPALRQRIQDEVDKLTKQKKFGLVFEEHLPERTPLYDLPIKKGSRVALKTGEIDKAYTVVSNEGNGKVTCFNKDDGETQTIPVDDLVCVAEFGEPIFPYLKPMDSVCNAPENNLWHTLIQADNYHALQLLQYLYAGKVDCIYIDPPYNTGARDWKYNNDYVDGNDAYRHSKWLSFMEKRLRIAKKLLNPNDSVLIVTIDEKEYLHLGCLLEELFPDARMQMVSTIIKPEGTQRRNEFSRTNEFIYFIMFGNCVVPTYNNAMFETTSVKNTDSDGERQIEWPDLRRRNRANIRSSRPNQFYPIYINCESGYIDSIGEALPQEQNRMDIVPPDGCYAFFPIAPDGREMLWGKHYATARTLLKNGYIKTENGKDPSKVKVRYLASGTVADIEAGEIVITGRGPQNEVIGNYASSIKYYAPKSVWNMASHNAQTNGSLLIKGVIGENRFSFPKSLYAVADCIRLYTQNKPEALIIDFFAGSGTTLHAVNLLNAEDGGHRRCIMVTNNEVSEDESKTLTAHGFKPGDDAWEKLGIAQYVTWPRTVCSIEGHDIYGIPLKGNYIGSDRPMSEGFNANVAFFKLGFLDKTSVELGQQFRELLPLLWLKAGSIGKCPEIAGDGISPMLLLPENQFAVLVDESAFSAFEAAIHEHPEIQTVYLITDYAVNYRSMANSLKVANKYQLYRDYLDNFRINQGRA